MRIRALIVDDEPLARRRVRAFLRTEADIEIVGESGNGDDAAQAIRSLSPHLVFLDIQMPGMDGFQVLQSLDARQLPLIVFVTAHDQYAVRAFEQRALDYLLKPFNGSRFQDTVARVRERLETGSGPEFRDRVAEMLRAMAGAAEPAPSQHLVVKTGSHSVVLNTARVEWLQAEGDYVRIHAGREVHLTRQTLNRMEAQLGRDRFVRVHRSTIVNIQCIKQIHSLPGGDQILTLRDMTRVTLSRGYRERLEHALRQRL